MDSADYKERIALAILRYSQGQERSTQTNLRSRSHKKMEQPDLFDELTAEDEKKEKQRLEIHGSSLRGASIRVLAPRTSSSDSKIFCITLRQNKGKSKWIFQNSN
jgi:hypothetical protein